MLKIQRGKCLRKELISVNDLRRIFKSIKMEGECIIWQGCTCRYGYARMKLKGKARFVHRVMFAYGIENVKSGYDIHHRCLNTLCVNPKHLFQCTRLQHVRLHNAQVN